MKKKDFIGLSTSLLVLLLGLYTRAYANVNKEFDYTDLQNFIYNASIQMGYTDTEAQINVNNVNTTDLTLLANILNNNDYCVISLGNNNGSEKVDYFEVRTRETNEIQGNNTYLDSSQHRIKQNNITGTKCYNNYYACYFHGNFAGTVNVPSTSNGSVNQIQTYYYNNTYYFYTNINIYTQNGGSTLIGTPPVFYNTNIDYFSGIYDPDPTPRLLYNQVESNTIVHVDELEDIPAYTNSPNNNLYLGYLLVPKTNRITDFQLTRAYYNNNIWNYRLVTNEYTNEYIYYDKYYEDNELTMYDVYMNNTLIQENNIYIITWWDKTKEPYETVTGTFYIKNGNTNIINGEVVPSGDTTTAILQNQEENDSFWKETYNNLFTIDSGDAEEIIENFLESSNLREYGLESGEKAILNVLNGEPSDFIISWSSVIIPNLKDNTPTQLVPAGNINFSKVSVTLGNENYTLSEERLNQFMIIIGWVQLIMGISVVILTIANVWETLMRALGVGVGLYEDNADEHSTIVNVGEDGSMRTTEIVKTPTKSRIWYIHKKY